MMDTRTSTLLAWGGLAGFVVFGAVAPLLAGSLLLRPPHLTSEVFGQTWIFAAALLPLVAVAALIAARRPENPLGWLILASAWWWAAYSLVENIDEQWDLLSGPPAELMLWLSMWLHIPPLMVFFAAL